MPRSAMHAVEAADHVAVDHVDDGLGDAAVDRLVGRHAFLDDDLVDLEAFLDHRHLVALLAVEARHVVGALHRHDAHAVGAGIGLDDDERLLGDAVARDTWRASRPARRRRWRQALLARLLLEVDLAAAREVRVDEPRIDADQLPRSRRPPRHRRRSDSLLRRTAQPACSGGTSTWPSMSRRIAGMPADRSLLSRIAQESKPGDADAVVAAHQRFEQQHSPSGSSIGVGS